MGGGKISYFGRIYTPKEKEYSEQVTFCKVTEQHSHVYLFGLYDNCCELFCGTQNILNTD